MRVVLMVFLSLLLWSMTISVKPGNRNSNATFAAQSCPEEVYGEILLSYLYTGRINRIGDNGHMLTVVLTSNWASLPSDIQQETYEAVACYAKAQQRAFQLVEVP